MGSADDPGAEAVAAHLSTLGGDLPPPLLVIVAVLDVLSSETTTPPGEQRLLQEQFSTVWASAVGNHERSAPVIGLAREVVVIIGLGDDPDPEAAVRSLVRSVSVSVSQSVSGDGGGGRHTFTTGVSRVVRDVSAIPAGYDQARRAAQVGRRLKGPSALAFFDELGAFRLLSLVSDVDELRSYVYDVLGELTVEGDPVAADLLATLRVLLDTNLNVAETSRRLHFHYNTLRYRINKLERILGPFVSDPDLRLDIALALRALQMQNV